MGQGVMTLAEVGLLAHVGRPTVTHWRTRYAARDPFPAPVEVVDQQELFACDDIVEWLARTNRSQNPDFRQHAIAFTAAEGRVLTDSRLFHGLSALLCLHLRGRLAGDRDDLLDLADEVDPDDEFLRAEVEALGDDVVGLAEYASVLALESLDPADPLDALLAGRRTPDRPAGGRVTARFAQLGVDVAVSLADQAGFDDPVICVLRADDVALLASLPARADERGPLRVALPGGSDAATRLARRWLFAHDLPVEPLPASDGRGLPDQAVVLLRLDDRDRVADLRFLNELTLEGSASMRAVVLGTAGALTGPLRSPALRGRPPASGVPLSDAGIERRYALKTGRTRAIVRLPRGFLAEVPAARTALWCLGPMGDPAETLCADVPALNPADEPALVNDLAAAMGGRASRRGRGASEGRYVSQQALELESGDLVGPHAGRRWASASAVGQLHEQLVGFNETASTLARLELDRLDSPGVAARQTVAQALASKAIELIPGASVEAADLVTRPDVPVVASPDELAHRETLTGLTHALLARQYGHVRLTEPGDIVVSARSSSVARVDPWGGVLVAAPARVLRCFVPPVRSAAQVADDEARGVHPRQQVFVPELVAAELVAGAVRTRDWRTWQLTELPPAAVAAASVASAVIAERRRQLEAALAAIPDLMSSLATALGAGMCTITVSERKSA